MRRANVLATLALVVALGATSYAAAVVVPRNSVGSAQIKPGGVANTDLRADGVTSGKVRDGTLLARDFARGALRAGRQGSQGAAGSAGAAGARGGPGPIGLVGETGPRGPRGPGGVAREFGVTERVGVGTFHVTFDQDIRGCVWSASLGYRDRAGIGEISAVPLPGTPEALLVTTYDSGGTPADHPGVSFRPFSLRVHCSVRIPQPLS